MKLTSILVLCVIGFTMIPVVVATDSTLQLEFSVGFSADPFIVPAWGPTGLVNLSIGNGGLFDIFTGETWLMNSIDLRIDENMALLPKQDVIDALVFEQPNYVLNDYMYSPSMSMSFGGFGQMRKYFLFIGGVGCPISGAVIKTKVPKGYLFSNLRIDVTHQFGEETNYTFNVQFWEFGQNYASKQEFGLLSKKIIINKLTFDEELYPDWYNWYVNPDNVTSPPESPYGIDIGVSDYFSLIDLMSHEVTPWYEQLEEIKEG